MCTINDAHPLGVEVHDYRGVAKEELNQIALTHARCPLEMDEPALVRLDLLKFGEHGDVVVFRGQHSVADGFASALLMEDLIKLVLRQPAQGPALSYADY